MGQAEPERDPTPPAPTPAPTVRTAAPQTQPASVSGGEVPRRLNLPPIAPPEERKPLSTRVKPSLKKVLEAYTQEIRDAGFNATQELVLDVLLRELRDSDELREKVAAVLVRELS
jgi:hypothetical protein